MRKLLSTIAAVMFAGGIAWGSNIPLFQGPIQPANIPAALNLLITEINAGTAGLNSYIPGPVASLGQTAEQSLASVSIPAGVLTTAGQGLRLTCAGVTAANTNNKTVKLY